MQSIIARAKINLTLHVSAPIKEGRYKNYHHLDSLVAFCDFGDELIIKAGDGFEITGEFGNGLSKDNDNLIIRARDSISTLHAAQIELKKHLPIASGIGGGSADAAAALLGLNQFWQIDKTHGELSQIGVQLGADVPVCIRGETCIMRGIGDDILPAPKLPNDIAILLANPLVECSTPAVYCAFDAIGKFEDEVDFEYQDCTDLSQLINMLNQTNNDLTEAAIGVTPQIGNLLQALENAPNSLFARMSGSGGTCFAIFARLQDAIEAEHFLREQFKAQNQKIWLKAGYLNKK